MTRSIIRFSLHDFVIRHVRKKITDSTVGSLYDRFQICDERSLLKCTIDSLNLRFVMHNLLAIWFDLVPSNNNSNVRISPRRFSFVIEKTSKQRSLNVFGLKINQILVVGLPHRNPNISSLWYDNFTTMIDDV